MKTWVRIITYVFVVLFLAFGIGMIYCYTNGFSENFKTFYLEYQGEKILSTTSTAKYTAGDQIRYDVKYTFDLAENGTQEYAVSIIPNPEADFIIMVDGVSVKWNSLQDFTSYFEILKEDSYFMINLPEDFTVTGLLSEVFGTVNISVSDDLSGDLFLLVVSSPAVSFSYRIAFSVTELSDQDGYYTIRMTATKGDTYWLDYDCPEKASAGKTVSFTVSVYDSCPYYFGYMQIYETETEAEIGYTEETVGYSFVMPLANVTIKVIMVDENGNLA